MIIKDIVFVILIVISLNGYSQGVLYVGDTINSNFIDIQDTTLPLVIRGESEFSIDIDNDHNDDLKFIKSHSSSPSYDEIQYRINSLDSVQFVCIGNSSEADTLSFNSIVDNNLNWGDNFNGTVLYLNFSSNIPPPWGPGGYTRGICKKDSLYIGFRKIYSTDTLYGWFHLYMNTFTILSYATDYNAFGESTNKKAEVLLYPNPACNKVYIESSSEIKFIEFYTLSGATKKRFNNKKDGAILDVDGFPKGVYVYKVMTVNNNSYFGKLIIK